MAKYIDTEHHLSDRWNFYIDPTRKINFMLRLDEIGYPNKQSAALRTLMQIFIEDKEVQQLVLKKIEENIVYRKNGKPSIM